MVDDAQSPVTNNVYVSSPIVLTFRVNLYVPMLRVMVVVIVMRPRYISLLVINLLVVHPFPLNHLPNPPMCPPSILLRRQLKTHLPNPPMSPPPCLLRRQVKSHPCSHPKIHRKAHLFHLSHQLFPVPDHRMNPALNPVKIQVPCLLKIHLKAHLFHRSHQLFPVPDHRMNPAPNPVKCHRICPPLVILLGHVSSTTTPFQPLLAIVLRPLHLIPVVQMAAVLVPRSLVKIPAVLALRGQPAMIAVLLMTAPTPVVLVMDAGKQVVLLLDSRFAAS